MRTHEGEMQVAQVAMGHSGDRKGIGIAFTGEDQQRFHVLLDWKQVERLRESLKRMVESIDDKVE